MKEARAQNERFLEQIKSGLSPTTLFRQPAGALTALYFRRNKIAYQLSYNESLNFKNSKNPQMPRLRCETATMGREGVSNRYYLII
jgi:hypothetical protein